jgi:hypothetical protein
MERITPEYLTSLVNFHSELDKPDWKYSSQAKDMRNVQARGAAKIFNLLQEHHIGLLADEVGMGKTIQSLAVCAALWNQKPDARILVFAPREVVARNWLNEYDNFIRRHYRHGDDIVKTASGNDPVKAPFYCTNLFALTDGIRQGWPHFYVAKTTSLSSLMAGDLADERLKTLGIKKAGRFSKIGKDEIGASKKVAELIKHSIVEAAGTGKPYFDLLIIDEAHYFRNVKADSLRQQTARILFGDPENSADPKLAKNVLLLTATPNHTSSSDILNILRQFKRGIGNPANEESLKSSLTKYCVRRLRKLGKENDAKIKYNYRNEIDSESDFAKDPLSEMFFGIYQHELVKMMRSEDNHSTSGTGINQIMKYLEGVEFIPETRTAKINDHDNEGTNKGTDFEVGSDGELLLDLSDNFNNIFGRRPSHPKYNRIVSDLNEVRDKEKTLVFVRRIASCDQIARQVMEHQDRQLWTNLQIGNLKEIDYDNLDRKSFTDALKGKVDIDDEINKDITEDSDEDTSENNNIPESKVLGLFKIKKGGLDNSTPASNFRKQFSPSGTSVMGIFFSPGVDYNEEPYRDLELMQIKSDTTKKPNYFNSAMLRRISKLEYKEPGIAKDILKNTVADYAPGENVIIKQELHTFFTIFLDTIKNDAKIDTATKNKISTTYDSFSPYEKEAFSKFIQQGALHASSAVVEFYRLWLHTTGETVERYKLFVAAVRKELPKMRLYNQVQDSIELFKTLYSKVFSITSQDKLLEEKWKNFDNAQPVYPYSRGNANKKILDSFNTPFFPDVLIATSVLQEGVNLQYFCDKVYHYGIAWTPGDNEQRVGRVDRMFGKIDRRLQAGEDANLKITFPFLKSTIDEEQLRRFIKKKFQSENLIDQGLSGEDGEYSRFDDTDNNDWQTFLRKPSNIQIVDPFPALAEDFDGVNVTLKPPVKKNLSEFFSSIAGAITEVNELAPKTYHIRQEDGYEKLLVDPTSANGRKQPVIIELVIDPIGSGSLTNGKAVYCLRMHTPICMQKEWRKLRNAFNATSLYDSYSYGIKLCLDTSIKGGSYWACYMAAELPLFITDPEQNPLNAEEIKMAFRQLVRCADEIEKIAFDRDKKMDELGLKTGEDISQTSRRFRSHSQSLKSSWNKDGDYYYLRQDARSDFNAAEQFKQAMILNDRNRYVKTYLAGKSWVHEVAYLHSDAQANELELMKKHLDVFMQRVEWE